MRHIRRIMHAQWLLLSPSAGRKAWEELTVYNTGADIGMSIHHIAAPSVVSCQCILFIKSGMSVGAMAKASLKLHSPAGCKYLRKLSTALMGSPTFFWTSSISGIKSLQQSAMYDLSSAWKVLRVIHSTWPCSLHAKQLCTCAQLVCWEACHDLLGKT